MTEGRGTGIPIIRREMEKNGSPEPRFETDDNYSYFITTLLIHPAFLTDDGVSGGVDGGVEHLDNKIDIFIKEIFGGVDGGVDDGVKESIKDIVTVLQNISGLNSLEISARINKSIRTTERYIQILRKKDIIEFIGIPKTGGYYLTKKAQNKLK